MTDNSWPKRGIEHNIRPEDVMHSGRWRAGAILNDHEPPGDEPFSATFNHKHPHDHVGIHIGRKGRLDMVVL